MKPAAQIKCPKCQNLLRVPPDVVDIAVKCKHCGHILQIRRKTAAPVAVANMGRDKRSSADAAAEQLPEYTPPAPVAAPIVEPLPEIEPQFNPDSAASRNSGRRAYKGPKRNTNTIKWIAVGSIVGLGVMVLAIVLLNPEWFAGQKPHGTEKTSHDVAKNDGDAADPKNIDLAGKQGAAIQTDPLLLKEMPRRIMAIGVSNYLYCNQVQNGRGAGRDRHDFYKAMERLSDAWRIPKTQRYYIWDGPTAFDKTDFKHPPLKMVVEGSIESFLNTSREQDRIILIFSGHALEKDGEVYLVPLEGEFEDLSSLIPLKDLYAKLGSCKAQEKLVIFDVCRSSPGRGAERPAFGKMTAAMEKAFHDCPEGVEVWTSCSADQYSYEGDGDAVKLTGLGWVILEQSCFLSLLFPAAEKGILGKREQGGNIQHPSDPFPLRAATAFMNEKTPEVTQYAFNQPQTPKFTSKARKTWLPFNPGEPLAPAFALTSPPPTARREEIAAMFKEIDLPPIKSVRGSPDSLPLVDSFPFTEANVKDFFNVGPTFDEIAKTPAKYAKEYPLRVATVEAVKEMRNLRNEGQSLPVEFRSPITDANKKEITEKYQRTISAQQAVLNDLKERLDEVAKKRDEEKSKRWLANFDYVSAQVKARLGYIFEYNLALGNVKTEKLPELSDKHNGWVLATIETPKTREVREYVEDAKTTFVDMAAKFPNTPYAVLAKSAKNLEFGLKWEPRLKPGG